MIRHPSPNFGPRRDGLKPALIILHYTAMRSAEAALERLCDPACEVSAHYLIGSDGTLWQLVDEALRAWHAGAGEWHGLGDVNSRSIGVELDNDGASPFPEPQMRALESLLPALMGRWSISPEGVIGHSDMAPGRKFDPGPKFDWWRLALEGLSIWPKQARPGEFIQDARQAGYPEKPQDILLDAFRLRFRPGATGPLCDEDRAMMAGLAALQKVDLDAASA